MSVGVMWISPSALELNDFHVVCFWDCSGTRIISYFKSQIPACTNRSLKTQHLVTVFLRVVMWLAVVSGCLWCLPLLCQMKSSVSLHFSVSLSSINVPASCVSIPTLSGFHCFIFLPIPCFISWKKKKKHSLFLSVYKTQASVCKYTETSCACRAEWRESVCMQIWCVFVSVFLGKC